MRSAFFAAALALAVTSFPPTGASAQDDGDRRFGAVHFDTSCNDTAQRRFDRAMRYQHSFWYRESTEIFGEALKADPGCAIAYWGIALSALMNPHIPPPKDNLALGLSSLEKGKALGAKTQRERDYIDALLVLYTDYETVPHARRVQAYLKAMEDLAARYPEDDEAKIGYAITLNVAASPNDKSYANQLKGAAILKPIFERQPRHPGVAHYLIHLYDYPAIADKGLDAAKRYAEIAPAAPHALHMPSHVFTRVGAWKESIESNSASARAAKAGREPDDQLHAMDYLVYAHLQVGQDRQARAVVDEMGTVAGYKKNVRTGPYAIAAGEARYAIERGDWKAAAALRSDASEFAYVEAVTRFARALGAARSGNAAAARDEVAKLAELRDKLKHHNDAYWAEQVDIQWQVGSAWLLNAENKPAEARAALGAAADAEDKTEKSIVTPGPLAPARELYGWMLLEHGMAREALAAFRGTLEKEPHRFGATVGAATAAEKAGDLASGKQYHAAAVALGEGAEPVRPELAHARAFVANN